MSPASNVSATILAWRMKEEGWKQIESFAIPGHRSWPD